MTTLLHERGTLGFALTGALEAQVGQACRPGEEEGRRRPDPPRPDRQRVGRAPGAEAHQLPLADEADPDRHPRPRGLRREAALVGAEPAADEARDGDPRGRGRRVLAPQQLRSRGNTIEAGTSRDPAQHHRRARARPPEESLVQFAFTEEQELLRREARRHSAQTASRRPTSRRSAGRRRTSRRRTYLRRPGGPVGRGRPGRSRRALLRVRPRLAPARGAARGAGAGGGRHRPEGARARRRARLASRSSSASRSGLPGRLTPARRHVHRDRARAVARLLGGVVRGRGRRHGADRGRRGEVVRSDVAVAACERSIQVHGGIGFTWEHVCTCTTSGRSGSRRSAATRASSARRSPRTCSTSSRSACRAAAKPPR